MDLTDVFDTIMFSGLISWIMLLVIIIIVFVVTSLRRPLGVLMVPVCILVGVEYLANGLGWHGIIMFLCSIFTILYIATKKE